MLTKSMPKTTVLLAILSTFALCGATLQISATFIAGMSVATNYTALRPYSEIQCAAKCFEEGRNNRCRVAGYSRKTHTCYLSLDSLQDVSDVADQNIGVLILEVIIIDECLSRPCLNGATCTDEDSAYTCTCQPGYTGNNCQTVSSGNDECVSNPCQNGGTCTNKVNGYACTCTSGYTGINCETVFSGTDQCVSSLCQNGGTCTDIVGGYTCTCPSGYTGTDCGQGGS